MAAGARWADQISLGVLASSVLRDVIDDVVAAAGRQAKRSDGKLPPHVMVYFAMACALFASVILRFRVSQGCDLQRPVVDSVADGTLAA